MDDSNSLVPHKASNTCSKQHDVWFTAAAQACLVWEITEHAAFTMESQLTTYAMVSQLLAT